MKKILIILILIFCKCIVFSQNKNMKMIVYYIPGQGADHRLFNNIELGENYEVRFVKYKIPNRGEKMEAYARRLATQIDTTQSFVLMGTSLGGMLATEMTDFLNPEKTIIISSAKCRKELPQRYRFQRAIPLHKLVPKGMMKWGAKIMQPIVEPDRNKEKETFKSMLEDKDKRFMKRSVNMIINWERESYDDKIIHIHGNKDNTLPIKKVKYDYLMEGGSHMMTLTRGKEMSELLKKILISEK
jgi:esterase/lipase